MILKLEWNNWSTVTFQRKTTFLGNIKDLSRSKSKLPSPRSDSLHVLIPLVASSKTTAHITYPHTQFALLCILNGILNNRISTVILTVKKPALINLIHPNILIHVPCGAFIHWEVKNPAQWRLLCREFNSWCSPTVLCLIKW